jgi:hypothetical protein
MRASPPSKASARASARLAWAWSRRYQIVYITLGAWFLLQVAGFYETRAGFTPLVLFGDRFAAQRLVRLRDVPIFTFQSSSGYDGQFYAQIAVAGNPFDPELRTALDSAPYRTRRVLLPAVAYGLGFGHPAWILNVYALLGVVSWLILGWLLGRWWFPPTDAHNLLRWVGILFGAGMLASVSRSLTDGPSLLLIAVGMRALETKRRWGAIAVLAAAGLAREISVLCATVFFPPTKQDLQAPRNWLNAGVAALLCALPFALWSCVLISHFGNLSGGWAFDLPLVGLFGKLGELRAAWHARGFAPDVRDEVWAIVTLCVQAGFILGRPRRDLPWWRIGASFSILFLCLGRPFWEGPPASAIRVVLPLALAFNQLVPRNRWGLVLLVGGNLSVLSAASIMQAPPLENTTLIEGVRYDYGPGWFPAERAGRRTWQWASGSATLPFHNSTARTFLASLDFQAISRTDRKVLLKTSDLQQSLVLATGKRVSARFGPFRLPPGDTLVTLETEQPAWIEPAASHRGLTFALENLKVTLIRK